MGQRKPNRKPSAKQPPPGNSFTSWLKKVPNKVWLLISVIATLLGVVTSAPFFKPKVELIIHESLREKSPLQLPVEIKNNSNFSLYDVESVMHTDRIVLAGNSVLTNTDLSGLDNKADRIRPDESFTFVETGMVLNGVPVAYGLVHFDVTYKFLWIHYSEEYHFKFAFGDNGKVVWMKRPKKID